MKNPPAFPRPMSNDSATPEGISQGDRIIYCQAQEGMTLLDYFAAASLTGIKANDALLRRIMDSDENEPQQRLIAIMAYKDADAMLEARKTQ